MFAIFVMAVVFGAAALSLLLLAAVVVWNVLGTYRVHARSRLLDPRRRTPA